MGPHPAPLQDDVTDDKGSDIQEARVILYRLFVRGHLQEIDDRISDVFSFFMSDSVVVDEEEFSTHDPLRGRVPLLPGRLVCTKECPLSLGKLS